MRTINIRKHNYFKRVLKVQEVYNLFKQEGLSDIYIYDEHIKDVFHISERTYREYLTILAKKEIRLIVEEKERLAEIEKTDS